MKLLSITLILLLASLSCQSLTSVVPNQSDIKAAVTAVIQQQQTDWNAGSVEDFMQGYFRSDSMRFASGGDVFYGFDAALRRFQTSYPDRQAMGTLFFSDIDVAVVSPDAAFAFGRWALTREPDHPNGLFTLLFRKTPDGWRIIHDHTSTTQPEN
ncbi:MAG: DUF3225 domain-containing protein [Planctomycetes bacterium]|nr:DUF3225 domain-containing protein [Planctomycetota bacterium]